MYKDYIEKCILVAYECATFYSVTEVQYLLHKPIFISSGKIIY